jgi:NAD(P)-dependent dehydrogenase (short-subunit alcohol dehydrogenase family)
VAPFFCLIGMADKATQRLACVFSNSYLTKRLMPLFGSSGRVINLSSAAQFPVDLEALVGKGELSDGAAYAESKLALTMWSRNMALSLKNDGPAIIAVNPRSMLGSKMVKQAYGVAGGDLRIGAEIA